MADEGRPLLKAEGSEEVGTSDSIVGRSTSKGPQFVQGPDDKPPPPESTRLILRPAKTAHWRAIGGTLALVAGIVYSVINAGKASKGEPILAYLWPLYITFIIYLVEALSSDTSKFLWTMKESLATNNFLQGLKMEGPVVKFHVETYHFETRVEHVHHRNPDGTTTTRTQTRRERVTTYRGSEDYVFAGWRDLSSPSEGMEHYALTKLRLRKYIVFHSRESRLDFDGAFETFKSMHRGRDTHMDASWNFTVPGFLTHMLALRDPAEKPALLGWGQFLAITLIGGSYPFRRWMSSMSMEADFTLLKEVSTRERLMPLTRESIKASAADEEAPAPSAPDAPGEYYGSAYVSALFPTGPSPSAPSYSDSAPDAYSAEEEHSGPHSRARAGDYI